MIATARFFAVLLAFAALAHAQSSSGSLKLVVAYCPTDFTSAGAIIDVNPSTGAYSVAGTFKWPDGVITGCAADYSPNFSYNAKTGDLVFDFVSEDGVFVAVDLEAATASKFVAHDAFFTGFENFAYDTAGTQMLGISGTVTQHGLCNDGCFQFGSLTSTGKYSAIQNVLFKESADDVQLYDEAAGYYYVQLGYDLREHKCAPQDSDECLLKIDATTGDIVSAIYTNYTIYGYAGLPASGSDTTVAWVNGFYNECNHPYNDFAFAHVNIETAEAELIGCIPKNVTVDMDEWVGSFSPDGAMFATASGNSEGDPSQMLVFDASSGDVVVQSALADLPTQLKAAMDLVFIWGVQFV